MSRLEKLIAELCPNGVEYTPLGKVCAIGKGTQFNKSDMNEAGTYPVINGGINPSGYIEKYNQKENTITISQGGASAGYVNWIKVKFWAGAHCYVLTPMNSILNRYLFHFVKSQEYRLQECQYGAGIPALSKATVSDLVIPVPPLPVQAEIVRILDNFTELTAELTADLTAELTTRRKQYEYYRDSLLTFDDDVPRLHLEKCLEKTNNIKWKQFNGTLEYIDLSSVDRDLHIITQTTTVNQENAPSRAQQIVQTNDVLFGSTRPMLKRSCFVTSEYDGQVCSTGFCVLRANKNKVLPAWIYYMISTADFYSHVELFQKGASYPAISDADIKRYEIPLPSLAEQEKIVNILGKFETLCNDISTGLPAEIAARQKQYEYYRDKLLTFKELT